MKNGTIFRTLGIVLASTAAQFMAWRPPAHSKEPKKPAEGHRTGIRYPNPRKDKYLHAFARRMHAGELFAGGRYDQA